MAAVRVSCMIALVSMRHRIGAYSLCRKVNVTNAPIKRVAIVGGGIGGLVLAHLLRASPSLSVMVYERDTTPEARAQGYYIGLQGAGLKVVKERLVSLAPSLAPIISDPNLALHGFAVLTSG